MLPRRNILIFHQAALGDFITTWPVAMAMGRVFAQSRVMYVTGSDKGRLAEDVIGVEGVSADDGWHALFGNAEPPENVARVLRGTQCVVLFAENDEPNFVAGLVKHCGDIPLIQIRPKPPAAVHVLDHQLAQLDAHGKLRSYVEQMQTLLKTHGFGRRGNAGEGVLIHPGSGSPAKNWCVEHFVELGTQLVAAGKVVRFVVGEVERDRWPASDISRLAAVAEVVMPDTLPALRKLIAGSHSFVGNDSGPTHLAAALGVRTVALFGDASDSAQWRPSGPAVEVRSIAEPPAAIAAIIG
ncbi:MAG: glycosyltransferase family 9 protein [Tepidisphaeraceae bacterium]